MPAMTIPALGLMIGIARENAMQGIESVRHNAPVAVIVDVTLQASAD
ncbi:MAG: YegP family protein [Dehalococcoidaceae bacterium]|nr:YegP family protein [Dehalococcoidaceae bacterium]